MIPPITDPLGKHWKQPPTTDVLIDGKYAVMSKATLLKLTEYSASMPSGVYPGKMWRAVSADGTQHLRWYGESSDPRMCSNHQREILIV